MFTFDIAKKEPRGSFLLFALLGQLSLRASMLPLAIVSRTDVIALTDYAG